MNETKNRPTPKRSRPQEHRRPGEMTTAEIATIISAGYEPHELVTGRAAAELAGCSRSTLSTYRNGRRLGSDYRPPELDSSLWLMLTPVSRRGRAAVFYFREALPVIQRIKRNNERERARKGRRRGRRAVALSEERGRSMAAALCGLEPGEVYTPRELAAALGCTVETLTNLRNGYRWADTCPDREPLLIEGEDWFRVGERRRKGKHFYGRLYFSPSALDKVRRYEYRQGARGKDIRCNDTTPVRHYNAKQGGVYA